MTEFRGYIMILGAAVLWGASATVAKFLLNRQIDTIILVQTRVTFSCLLLLIFFLLFRRDVLLVPLHDLWQFALLGVIGVAGSNFTYYFTIRESTVATAILIQYTAPLLVLAYATLSREESVSWVKVAAALVSLGGCFLAVGAYDAQVLRITPIGLVSGLGSVICFSFLNIHTRRLLAHYNVWTVVFYSIAFASLFWLLINPPHLVIAENFTGEVWIFLVVLAIISILIPHSLYFAGLKHIVASRAIITSTFEPIVAILTAALFLGELLEGVQVIGAVLVISAILLLQTRRESAAPAIPVGEGMHGKK